MVFGQVSNVIINSKDYIKYTTDDRCRDLNEKRKFTNRIIIQTIVSTSGERDEQPVGSSQSNKEIPKQDNINVLIHNTERLKVIKSQKNQN